MALRKKAALEDVNVGRRCKRHIMCFIFRNCQLPPPALKVDHLKHSADDAEDTAYFPRFFLYVSSLPYSANPQ